jgi:hypothetical protein
MMAVTTQSRWRSVDGRLRDGNSPDAGSLSDGCNEPAQPVEKLLTVALGSGSHHVRFNRAEEPRSTVPELRSTEADPVFA